MAFEGLSSKLQEVTRKLRGKARITEKTKDTGYHSAEFHCTARCS